MIMIIMIMIIMIIMIMIIKLSSSWTDPSTMKVYWIPVSTIN